MSMFHTKEQRRKLFDHHIGVGFLILKTSDDSLTEWTVYCHKGELRNTADGKAFTIYCTDEDGNNFTASTDLSALTADRDRLQRRCDELEAALKPFAEAEAVNRPHVQNHGDFMIASGSNIYYSDLRRAAALLKEQPK